MTKVVKLTGGQTAFGSGVGNTATDDFLVSNSANTVEDLLSSNLIVNGTGTDSGTTIRLGAGSGVTDHIRLHGSGNSISDGGEIGLKNSTIQVTVSGPDGGGHNSYSTSNYGGTNIVSFNGVDDFVNTITFFAHGTTPFNFVMGPAKSMITTGANARIMLTSGSVNIVDTTNSVAIGGSSITIGLPYDEYFASTLDIALGAASIKLSGDNNTVSVGSSNTSVTGGASFNKISLSDGNDLVALTGEGNLISVGAGTNTVMAGSGNDSVTITGPGQSKPIIGFADVVVLKGSGNSVTLTATSPQTPGSPAANFERVTVDGAAGTGNSTVTLGNGTDSVTLGGSGNTVTLGDGSDKVIIGGASIVTVGNGSDVIKAGAGSTVTVGSGNDTISTGDNSAITVHGGPGSVDTINPGNGSTVNATGGALTITAGSNDNFYLNSLSPGSKIVLTGTNDQVFLGSNSSALVQLNASKPGQSVVVQGTAPDGLYSGTVTIANFGPTSKLDLQGLISGDPGNGNLEIPGFIPLDSYAAVINELRPTGTSVVLSLKGGGAIVFAGSPIFQASEFAFSSNRGPVHA